IVIYVFTIVAFPRLSLSVSDGEDRFKMLLPGHAWNQLVIAAIIFNLPYIRKRKSVMFSTAFAVIWYSLNGERADISGLILGIFIISMLSKNISKKIKFYSLILLFFSIIVYITIGNLRIHGGSVAVSKSFVEIATFSTVSDVAYIMNACIDYTHVIGHTGGKLLMELPSYAIPLTQHGSIGAYVDRFYADPGGTPLITPAILDFGKIGMFIYSFIYSILLGFITYFKESKLVKYEILLIACSIPRICWYGVNYVFPSFVFFIPILYLINIFINDFANNNNEKM
ncbi:MAG: hypothetical protein M3001_11530, partial [Staphylococcus epidermidis]|nr:hypothetical protein [Staphylococcus epidermidis]